jgi:hypothetical protein
MDWLTIDGLSTIETLLIYCGVGVVLYLCYLQFVSVKRRRRHRRHRARKRAHEAAAAERTRPT